MNATQLWKRNRFPIVAAVIVLIAAAVFHRHILAWFAGPPGDGGGASGAAEHVHGASGTASEPPGDDLAVGTHALSEVALAAVRDAMTAYEGVRTGLAQDNVAAARGPANALSEALHRAHGSVPADLGGRAARAADAAQALGGAQDLAAAREAFAQVSEALVAIATADPRLLEGQHVFQCPMTEGYNRWLQPSERLQNPYKGAEMLTCGTEVEPQARAAHAHDPGEIAYYTCPMHTWVKEQEPGTCPVCGMDLTPVTKEEVHEGVIRIDHDRRQLIGVKLAKVEPRLMVRNIQGVGTVKYDESRLTDVALKYEGWIDRLEVDEPGQAVKKGQTLLHLYSPQLYAAQQEYLLALRQAETARSETSRERAQALVRGARRRLELWDIGPGALDRIARTGEPLKAIPIASPASGYVIEKNVVEGSAVKPGQQLFRIAALDRVWVEAEIYEQDIPLVEKGQRARVTLSHLPGKTFEGTISFIYPYLDGMQRTARARIELPNDGLVLKPDMFAQVEIRADLGERLAVPEPAVIYSGPRRIVFVDIGQDRLKPRVIETGVKSDGYYEVLSGLEAGDEVVISGNFLVTSESRLKSATGLW